MSRPEDLAEAARLLRAVVDAVERGELDGPPLVVAYLAVAAESTPVLAERMISVDRA